MRAGQAVKWGIRMRRFVALIVTLGAVALPSAAFAVVDETKDVPVTNQGSAIPEGHITIETTSGKTIGTAQIVKGKAHLHVVDHDKNANRDEKVVTKIHDNKTGKTYTERDKPLGALLDLGIDASTGGAAGTSEFTMSPPSLPSWTYGVMFGGDFVGHTGVNSTSGFYQGGYGGFAGIYGGLFADVPFARSGSQPVTLQSWIWSLDPVLDFMHSSGLHYSGTGGGLPVTGSGSLSQYDFLLILKATTPLTPTSNLAFFGGLGGASLRPGGQPTGPGGPSYSSSSLVPAFRAGVEASQRLNAPLAVALQAFYQHTDGATFDTSLPGERFKVKDNDSFMLGLTFTIGDNTPPTGLQPGGPVISQEKPPTYVTTEHKATKGRKVLDGGVCIKGGNCGAFIWQAVDGGNVFDSQRIAIYKSGLYVKATTKKPCDVIFYNDASNENNSHVEFVTDVDSNGNVTGTIGQDGGNRPITTGPPGADGQTMTIASPPAGGPSDADITAARQKVKDPSKLKDWEPFLKLCRERNKVDLSKFPAKGP